MAFTCKYCEEEFERKVDLANHVKSKHKEEKKREKKEKEEREEEEEERARQKREKQIYKPTDPREIMMEVARGPLADFTERQIAELQDIAEDYEGMLTPELFGEIVVNFDKVGQKRAAALKQRYAVKLNRAQENLSVAHAGKLGLLGESSQFRQPHLEHSDDLGEIVKTGVKTGIAEGIKEGRKGLNVDSDILKEPLQLILTNMAKTSGMTSRGVDLIFHALHKEIDTNPAFRKKITDHADGLISLLSRSGEETEEGKMARMEAEEKIEKLDDYFVTDEEVKSTEKEKALFGGLDSYFEKGEETP